MKKLLILIVVGGVSFFSFAKEKFSKALTNYMMGLLCEKQNSLNEAEVYFKKAKKLDPDSESVCLNLAKVYLLKGEFKKAEKELKLIKKKFPSNLEAKFLLVLLYIKQNKKEAAESEYEELLENIHHLRPEEVEICLSLANVYLDKKNYKGAENVLKETLKKNPDNEDLLYFLGYVYYEEGKVKKAIAIWKKVLKINPNHADSLNSLGYTYAEQGINLKEALVLIKKALKLSPKNGAYLDSLGWVYFKKKEYQKALKYLKKAIKYLEDPVIYEHLGDVYFELKDYKKAEFFWKKSLELKETEIVKEKIKKIKCILKKR